MSFKALALAVAAATALAAGAAAPALAHHSFAMFANDKTMVVKGTVKEFEWTNPHAWLHVSVMTPEGATQNWSFEMGSPAQLSVRGGLKPDSLKPGDSVSVQIHPMKDGSHGGSYMAAKLASGATFGNWQADKPAAP